MPSLLDCLNLASFRHLWTIAQAHYLNAPQRHPPKDLWVQTLHAFLSNPANLQTILSQLSPADHDALHALLDLPHPALQHAFCARHGVIRPYRPWNQSTPLPDRPWRFPASSAERLWYLGLLFPAPPDRPGGQTRLTLADEHRAFLRQHLLQNLPLHPQPPTGLAYEPPLFDALYDLTVLLALLHQHDIAPVHQRWLPAPFLQRFNQQTRRPAPFPGLRSELQAPRLHFLHYLAHTLGLLAPVGDFIKPSPTLPLWLQAAPTVRIQQLWNAWLQPDPWRTFRLPGAATPDPIALVQHLLHLLSLAPAAEWRTIPQLLKELKRFLHPQPVWWQTPTADDSLPHLLTDLFLGPLTWLGCVNLQTENRLQVQLTPAARAFLQAAPLSPLPAPQPFTLSLDPERITLRLPDHDAALATAQVDLARLHALISQFGSLSFGPDDLALALASDTTLDAVLQLLSDAAGRPIAADEYATLRRWAATPAPITIHRLTVLETTDPAHLTALTTRRTLRPLLGRTLNRRLIVIPDRHLPRLIGRLRLLGIPHRLTIPNAAGGTRPGKPKIANSGYLYLAGLVFQQLNRFTDLPVRLPAAILDQIAAGLPPETASDLHALAEELLTRLQTAFDGYSGPPLDNPHPVNLADTQARLTAAIAGEHSVELTYWTAGRGELTHRRVDPYRLETRGAVTYLIAYCHLRRAERVFRLDRILAVAESEPPTPAPPPAVADSQSSATISQPPPQIAATTANDDDLIVPF
ncbi:MAG: WYL domain-containing protein [Anaerolineae bacterium]|nr:WYL domain-containing protein [Anaerolineae bacterium]